MKAIPHSKPQTGFERGHAEGCKGRHGGTKMDRFDKRQRKIAQVSRRRNRR